MCAALVADASAVPRRALVSPSSPSRRSKGDASWLCEGGRWVEWNSESPDLEERRSLLGDSVENETLDRQDAAPSKPPRLPVAADCFALVRVAEELSPPGTLLTVPLVCVAGQCTVLIFMATTNEYAFAEGVWLTPRSDHASLMAMRLVGLMLSLLKASGEFANTLALFQALWLGEPPKPRSSGGPGIRWAASTALILQYLMALAVVFTSAQIVLAERSPIYALLKVLSAWVVVDMDNYLAQYVVEVLDWRHLVWSVPMAPDLPHPVPTPEPCPSGGRIPAIPAQRQLSLLLRMQAWRPPGPSDAGGQVHIPRSKAARVVFFGVPAALVLLEVGLALALDVLPFTYLSRGFVSNQDAPMLLAKGAGLPDGCCPPVLESLGHGRGWNFSVLLLMPRSTMAEGVDPPAPQLFWVALAGTASAPSSLQVIDGLNGDGVPAVQVGGRVRARRTQAYWWLLKNHYGHDSTERIFEALMGRRGLGLYNTHLPYSANFTIADLRPASLDTYRIYVAAQNTKTLALSPEPVFSSPLHVSGCSPGCVKCGGDPSRCFECSVGRHWSAVQGLCTSCAEACLRCDSSGDGLCDLHACKTGFGLTEAGVCAACNVTGCSICDRHQPVHVASVPTAHLRGDELLRPPTGPEGTPVQAPPVRCDACEVGYGLLASHRRCLPCGPHCERCEAEGEGPGVEEDNETHGVATNCSVCARGFGLVKLKADERQAGRSECVACQPHCRRCRGPSECLECAPGFAPDAPGGNCTACADGCQNCTGAGPGQCDAGGCRNGYGYYHGQCQTCNLAHCVVCNFTQRDLGEAKAEERCSRCREGFGRTQDGVCEDCGDSCLRCDRAGACEVCIRGYTTDHDPSREGGGRCQACGDRCERCEKAGPARCDHCISGYELDEETLTCLPITRVAVDEV